MKNQNETIQVIHQSRTIIALAFIVCVTIGVGVHYNHLNELDANERNERIEAIRVEKQHELEVTKQKAIEMDKSRKRKIWERAMPEEGPEDSSHRGH